MSFIEEQGKPTTFKKVGIFSIQACAAQPGAARRSGYDTWRADALVARGCVAALPRSTQRERHS